jgi:hypothetical protein
MNPTRLLDSGLFWLNTRLWRSQRGVFYRDMADALRRKVGLRDFLAREVNNRLLLKDSTGLAIMRHLSDRYATGQGITLRELLAKTSPGSDGLLLMSVDEASDKATALERVADTVDFQNESLKIVRSNLLMPALAVPIVGILCVITAQIILGVAQDASPKVWEGFNGQVRWVATLISNYWWAVITGLLGAVGLIGYQLPRGIGAWRIAADEWPLLSLYRDYQAAIVLSGLAMMLDSGKTLRQSIDDMRPSASPWLRWQLARMALSLEDNPRDYLAAFSRGLMPRTVRARLSSLLDSSKSFDEALVSLGSREVKRLQDNIATSAKAMNWTLTGVLVGLAVYLSIGQMTIVSALSKETEPSQVTRTAR